MRGRIVGSALAAALFATGAMGMDLTTLSPTERAAFQAEVRAYLLENPEVIEEAQQALEERRAATERERDAGLVAAHADQIYDDAMSPMIGDPDAPFTVVKFNDFNCGHCRAVEPDLAAFLEQNPDYKLVVKEFPVLGANSVIAASFAVTIFDLGGPGAYATVKSRLFSDEAPKTAEDYRALAAEVGVDPDLMSERMGGEEVRAHLQRNVDLAGALEIRGTPGFLFEDVIIRGRIPLETMGQIRGYVDNR